MGTSLEKGEETENEHQRAAVDPSSLWLRKRASLSNLVQSCQEESEVTVPSILDPRPETNPTYAAETNPLVAGFGFSLTKFRNPDAVSSFDCIYEYSDSDPTSSLPKGKSGAGEETGSRCSGSFPEAYPSTRIVTTLD